MPEPPYQLYSALLANNLTYTNIFRIFIKVSGILHMHFLDVIVFDIVVNELDNFIVHNNIF